MAALKWLFNIFKKPITTQFTLPKSNNRAVYFAITDYKGMNNDLKGCINDAKDWLNIFAQYNYETLLVTNKDCTRDKFKSICTEIIKGADNVVIGYSGHGTNIPDYNGDESDGRDEAICLYDGNFIDDDIYTIVKTKADTTKLLFIADSCHSGTISKHIPNAVYERKSKFVESDDISILHPIVNPIAKSIRTIPNTIYISACNAGEVAYDAYFGKYNGAFTYYSNKILQQKNITYRKYFTELSTYLPSMQYNQSPQIEATEELMDSIMFI